MGATGSPAPVPAGPPSIDRVAHERRAARRFRPYEWLLVGLGLALIVVAVFDLIKPVTTKPSASCGRRPAIVAAFGPDADSSAVPGNRDWCRRQARSQVASGVFGGAVIGGLILAGVNSAQRARRAKEPPEDAAEIARPPEDVVPGGTGPARPTQPRDVVGPSRTMSGRLVAGDTTWLVVEDRPGHSTLLMVKRRASELPFSSREFEVSGDLSGRVTFGAPGAGKTFTARPAGLDRFHHWWTIRSHERHRAWPATDSQGPSSQPSIVAAAPTRPDPGRRAWAHPPARRSLWRSLGTAGLILAAALVLALVIVWAAVADQGWFWEPGETGDAEGISFADMAVVATGLLILAGAFGIARFLRRWHILRRRPWELADTVVPEPGHVVLREHGGPHGPLKYKVDAIHPIHANARVLACKQLWVVRTTGGRLIAATPDFRTMVGLEPE